MFVFYFQGAQGDDPITAGIKLAPMAIGMLISSPLAGIWADRHGSRTLAALGMVVSAVGLAAMTTLGVDSPYWQSSLWLLLVGIGSGMFNSPNTAAMMGVVPANRRGVAAGARMMLQNTGAVLSIAFVMAIVTAAVPKDVLLAIFSGVTTGLSPAQLEPFIHNMHTALWVLAATSVVGAFVSLLRPATASARARGGARMTTATPLRIGEVAERLGTTPRTIRYYEEIGLLARRRARGRPPPHLRGGRRRAPQRRPALQAAARPQPRRAQGAARGRGGPRRAAHRVARARPRRGPPPRDPRAGARPHRPPARAGPPPPADIDALEGELATSGAGSAQAARGVGTARAGARWGGGRATAYRSSAELSERPPRAQGNAPRLRGRHREGASQGAAAPSTSPSMRS